MRIKKFCTGIWMSAVLMATALPVWATQNLTDVNPSGDTTVTADVSNGDVAYIISIPETIDFGKLTPPPDNTTPHIKEVSYTVGAVQIEGLDTKTSRVAVLLKDSTAGTGFQITGSDASNSGKTLSYSVLGAGDAAISEGKIFPNGYLLTAFQKANDTVSGTLKLDQNQLYGKDMNAWAGNYQGTINFYSKIATIKDVE